PQAVRTQEEVAAPCMGLDRHHGQSQNLLLAFGNLWRSLSPLVAEEALRPSLPRFMAACHGSAGRGEDQLLLLLVANQIPSVAFQHLRKNMGVFAFPP